MWSLNNLNNDYYYLKDIFHCRKLSCFLRNGSHNKIVESLVHRSVNIYTEMKLMNKHNYKRFIFYLMAMSEVSNIRKQKS